MVSRPGRPGAFSLSDRRTEGAMVIALAGRRIDASDATIARFPLANVPAVRERIRTFFAQSQPKALVSSAACGADLIAQEEAGRLGVGRRVVLPYGRKEFRATSVTDRPGDWGALYDGVLDEIGPDGIIVLAEPPGPSASYLAANLRVLEEAESLARQGQDRVLAVLVGDGRPRGTEDLTKSFGEQAVRRGIAVEAIATLV